MTNPRDPWTIILAAGASTRFNGVKALAPWGNGTLLSNALGIAAQVTGENVLVVTGGHHDHIVSQLGQVRHVCNANWQVGMGNSIAEGIRYLINQQPQVVALLPVDQPLVTVDHLLEIVWMAYETNRPVLSRDTGINGPPGAFPFSMLNALIQLSGDQGFKKVFATRDFATVTCKNVLHDADTPAMLDEIVSIAAGAQRP